MSEPADINPLPSLANRCEAYLKKGAPTEMTHYVPGSMLEIILSHGAKALDLDPELREIGEIVLQEAEVVAAGEESAVVRAYLQQGVALTREVLER